MIGTIVMSLCGGGKENENEMKVGNERTHHEDD